MPGPFNFINTPPQTPAPAVTPTERRRLIREKFRSLKARQPQAPRAAAVQDDAVPTPPPLPLMAQDQNGKWKMRRTPALEQVWQYIPAGLKLPE